MLTMILTAQLLANAPMPVTVSDTHPRTLAAAQAALAQVDAALRWFGLDHTRSPR